jgi:hypothetical protein
MASTLFRLEDGIGLQSVHPILMSPKVSRVVLHHGFVFLVSSRNLDYLSYLPRKGEDRWGLPTKVGRLKLVFMKKELLSNLRISTAR